MRVLLIEPGRPPEERDIEPGLATLQGLVGGYIDIVHAQVGPNLWVDVVCNDEGLLRGLPWNLHTGHQQLCGVLVIVGHDGQGETVGLTEDQIDGVMGALALGLWRRFLPTPSRGTP